jgi:hypothetical protein
MSLPEPEQASEAVPPWKSIVFVKIAKLGAKSFCVEPDSTGYVWP